MTWYSSSSIYLPLSWLLGFEHKRVSEIKKIKYANLSIILESEFVLLKQWILNDKLKQNLRFHI